MIMFRWRNLVTSRYLLGMLLISLVITLSACGEKRFEARFAPEFVLPRLDAENDLALKDYRGQVVYLSFWASWCIPCRQEMPYLAQLKSRHGEQGFEVIAINVDVEVEKALAFMAEVEMPFPVVRDELRAVSADYNVPGYPTHYVLDRQGRIRYSGLGFQS